MTQPDKESIDAMAAILKKLNDNVYSKAQEVVTESYKDPDIRIAVDTKETTDGIEISRYKIVAEKKDVNGIYSKNFYHIYDNDEKEFVHTDLGLFESAMGIVKHMLYTGKQTKIQQLLSLDLAYTTQLSEAYTHKSRMKTLTEGTAQHDVTSAKYSNSKQKLYQAKMQILKTL